MKQTKVFIIKKYVNASTAAEAIQRERSCPVDDVIFCSSDEPRVVIGGFQEQS